MDLKTFKVVVDDYPDEISKHLGDLAALHAFVGLPESTSYRRNDARDALYEKIRSSFTAGQKDVVSRCGTLITELIQNQIIDGDKIDFYFAVLDHLKDAVRSTKAWVDGPVQGDWTAAIRYAADHVRLQDFGTPESRERGHAREYMVARAAKRLKDAGFVLQRDADRLELEPTAETRLVERLEQMIAAMGGINLARRIFREIAHLYDDRQERYHIVPHPSATNASTPQIPWSYLLLLAAKHYSGTRPVKNTDEAWNLICGTAMNYAAVLDVQVYNPFFFWHQIDAHRLLEWLQQFAVHDTLFRIPQIRGSDVAKLATSIFAGLKPSERHQNGWTINDVVAVCQALMDGSRNTRGPIAFTAKGISDRCNGMNPDLVAAILDDVLTHPSGAPNQQFSKPTDAPPIGGSNDIGHNYYQRPLVSFDRKSYWLFDHAVGAMPSLEAMMTVLRGRFRGLDGLLGTPVENFLRSEFAARRVPTLAGKYGVKKKDDGECDLVVETPDTIIFFEMKKKALTRRAQAGSNAHALLDLAKSALAAQVQAGWHEVRLRRDGYIDLDEDGKITRLQHNGRHIERIAVSLTQFGGFQDRVFLHRFLEAIYNSNFSVTEPTMQKDFAELNDLLQELRDQLTQLHPGATQLDRAFFHCWFLSVPQILILLDDTHDPASFRAALWKTRHFATGSSDFYHDYAFLSGWKPVPR